jgi:hypothetical protein
VRPLQFSQSKPDRRFTHGRADIQADSPLQVGNRRRFPIAVIPDSDRHAIQTVGLLALGVVDHHLVVKLGRQEILFSRLRHIHLITSFL